MKKILFIFFVLVFICALLFRLEASRSLFWFDEAFTAAAAKNRTIPEVISAVKHYEFCPPLSFIPSNIISRFTLDETAHRMPAIILSLLSVLLVWLLTAEYETRIRLYAVCFSAFSPFMIAEGAEARMYCYFLFFTLLSCVLIKKTESKKSVFLLALVFAAGMYSHYFFGFVILALAAQDMIQKKKILTPVFYAGAGAGILFLPWVPAVFFQLSNSWPSIAPPVTLRMYLSTLCEFFLYQTPYTSSDFFELALLLSIVFLGLRSSSTHIKTVCTALIIGTAAVFLVSLKTRTLTARYIIFAAPAFYIIAAAGLDRLSKICAEKEIHQTVIAGLCLFSLLSNGMSRALSPARTDYPAILSYIAAVRNPDEKVYVSFHDRAIIAKFYAEKLKSPLKDAVLPSSSFFTENTQLLPQSFWALKTPPGDYRYHTEFFEKIDSHYITEIIRIKPDYELIRFRLKEAQ